MLPLKTSNGTNMKVSMLPLKTSNGTNRWWNAQCTRHVMFSDINQEAEKEGKKGFSTGYEGLSGEGMREVQGSRNLFGGTHILLMLMTLKTSPLFRFLTQERFGHQLVTSPTHIRGGELWCLRATIIPTTAASMLSSKICCRKVSLYLLPSLYNFHNLTRCRLSNFFSVNPPVQQRREVG